MIYKSLLLRFDLHVEDIAAFLIDEQVADTEHCRNTSFIFLHVSEFGVAYVMLAFLLQVLTCFAVFWEMQRYKKGVNAIFWEQDLVNPSVETYPGFNAVALCAVQIMASGFLFSRIFYYYEAL